MLSFITFVLKPSIRKASADFHKYSGTSPVGNVDLEPYSFQIAFSLWAVMFSDYCGP